MIYQNDSNPDKTYRLYADGFSGFKLIEYHKDIRKTSLTLSANDKIIFEQRLKENGWYERNN